MPETAIQPVTQDSPSFVSKLSQNILASLVRVFVVALVALVLPAFLTHHLPVTTYAAWVLIIQLAAYVSYLDLGIQTGVSKFVAEFDARGDIAGAGRHASAGFALMFFAGSLGVLLTCGLARQVPRLFRSMPSNLYHDVRVSVLLVGASLSFGLVCAVYSAVFLGLQRYWIPMSITIFNRVSYAAIVIAIVALRGSLEAMGTAVAAVNVVTGALQVLAWRKKASHIRVSLRAADSRVLKNVTRFCSLQSVWMMAMLCIAGLDVTIVGHYDYLQTAYYSIATLPVAFVLMIMSAMLNPLMPASSALSTYRSSVEMGDLVARVTRYSTLILLLTGLPLIVFGYPILRLWVGEQYALHTLPYLRILVFANIVRNLFAPYVTMIVATDNQSAAITAAVSEAVVNLGSSIYLASRFGAIGVALGTVLGAFVSIALHFGITMRFTYRTLAISRLRLFGKGMLRPAIIAIPSLVMLPLCWSPAQALRAPMMLVWCISTVFCAWYGGLTVSDRSDAIRICRDKVLEPLMLRASANPARRTT
ncbi:MAG TPA: polysaccharide biosynthesis C-terminal domain-containing protein [Terriglobales bacterium]|nr:polysaccharide biosynthesis C-terminal domain-containing protein [Terriglobales bacterium]